MQTQKQPSTPLPTTYDYRVQTRRQQSPIKLPAPATITRNPHSSVAKTALLLISVLASSFLVGLDRSMLTTASYSVRPFKREILSTSLTQPTCSTFLGIPSNHKQVGFYPSRSLVWQCLHSRLLLIPAVCGEIVHILPVQDRVVPC